MKKQLIIIIALAAAIISCKKHNELPSVTGYWAGIATDNVTFTPAFIGVLYNSDGSLRAYDNIDTAAATKGVGTYIVGSDSVRMNILLSSTLTRYAARLNDSTTNMTGTFKRYVGTFGGVYELFRQ